jgi:hypothetical protein
MLQLAVKQTKQEQTHRIVELSALIKGPCSTMFQNFKISKFKYTLINLQQESPISPFPAMPNQIERLICTMTTAQALGVAIGAMVNPPAGWFSIWCELLLHGQPITWT